MGEPQLHRVHPTHRVRAGVGTFEFAALQVSANDPCTAARTLAAQAWANLPS
jgi:hypothetical protein